MQADRSTEGQALKRPGGATTSPRGMAAMGDASHLSPRRQLIAWALALGVLIPAVQPSMARAVTIDAPGDPSAQILQQWANEDRMPAPTVTLPVLDRECSPMGSDACMIWTHADGTGWCGEREGRCTRMTMVFPTVYYPDELATHLEFLHELGHVSDFTARSHGYRVTFWHIMRYGRLTASQTHGLATDLEPEPWMFPRHGREPHEQFAMAYSYCADGLSYPAMEQVRHTTYWGYEYAPSRRQYERTCALLDRL